MRRLSLLLATIAALAAAGCGQSETAGTDVEQFQGEQKAVAQVVADLQEAGEAQDAEKICNDILAPSLVRQIAAAGADCAAEMKKSIQDADDFQLETKKVTVNGTRAVAEVTGQAGDADRTVTFKFVKEGGKWRAESL